MNKQINVRVQDSVFSVDSGTTPKMILDQKYKKLSNIIVCKINDKLSDLSVILTQDSTIQYIPYEEAKNVFWHSSAHILGNALVNLYPNCKLVNGPAIDEGFFYDIDVDTPISSEDFERIENEMKKLMKKNIKFEKIMMSKEDICELYKNNECKLHFVNTKVKQNSSVYKNNDFFDLCEGPHIPSTGYVKAVKIYKCSSAYFLNDNKQKQLQRIYGITFPTKLDLCNWNKRREEAKSKDHRKIGKELDLFFFHEYSPGSCFFLPNGTYVYNKLMEYLRQEYIRRGFREVITPNVFSIDLWKESGHYDNYKDNMFMLENENMAMKPMNCPGHCLMFKSTDHSFRELPIRYADFGVLHRNELSGALTGLTRVRRFQQDDAHIFCAKHQVKEEIKSCLSFLKDVYNIFKFKFTLFLSTRPDKYIGEIQEWDVAEEALRDAILESDLSYTLNAGDGAFYGPKIDIILEDALGRKNQCATIQLDFQLPQRFKLRYRNKDGVLEVPVIIHRAIFGSIERFIAILLESYGKKLPFWLTPNQIGVVSLVEPEYTDHIRQQLDGYKLTVLNDNNTLNKNIKILLNKGYSFIGVIGKKEQADDTINLRVDNKQVVMTFKEFKQMIDVMQADKIEYSDYIDISQLKV